ncbi:MAG: fibronectin, type [Bacteroidetes bacterium]|nr:fibronectin, type [Bacteroidota bacterium]
MKKTLFFLVGALISAYGHSQSQLTVLQDWKTSAGTQHFFYKNVTRTDGSGNVFVAGATQTAAGDYDILLAKFNSSGVQQWIRQIDGLDHAQDFATSIQLDGSGNVYITGAITNDTTNHYSDLIVVKYNSSGTEQWRGTYDGANLYDCGTDIFVATNGTVVVTGSSYNSSVNLDFISLSYNSSGVQQFATRFNHTSNMNDVPVRIIKSGSSIYISGAVQTGTTTYDWAEVKYNTSGVQQAVKISTGGTTGIEEVHAMVQDASGNLYLAGITPTVSNGYDYDIIKMDSSLNILWEHTYDGAAHLNDIANGIQVSNSGDVYVTGATRTATGDDYLTLKYNSSGSLIWARTFNDSLNGNDIASAMAMDNNGKIYITGSAQTAVQGLDYYTVKYDTAGTVIWSIYYDGESHLDDRATNIAIDTVGAVVVTGASETAAGVYEYATVRYVEKLLYRPNDTLADFRDKKFLFFENKGQLKNYSGSDVDRLKFYTLSSGADLYFQYDTMNIVYKKVDTVVSSQDTVQRIDMALIKPNRNAKIYAEEQAVTKLNYFTHSESITDVNSYRELVVPEVYTGIDLYYDSNLKGLKFYFVVRPDGDPADIGIRFTGADVDSIYGTDSLLLKSFAGIMGLKLHAFQGSTPISASLAKDTNDVYSVSGLSYNTALPLTIKFDQGFMPREERHLGAPEWCTPFGGIGSDAATDVKTDADGNSYWCGYTNSDNSFPASAGATFPFNANFDAFICKFGSPYWPGFGYATHADELQWLAFWGGSNDDKALALDVTGNSSGGHVYVTGYTESSDFVIPPTANPFYNDSYSGGKDAFILDIQYAAFATVSGATSTFLGGSGDDIANDIKYKSNVLAIGGITYSTASSNSCVIPNGSGDNGFPVCSTTFHNSNSGNGDGFLIKVNNSAALVSAEFIGGVGYDVVNEIAFNGSSDLLFTGTTASSAATFNPITLTGAYNQGSNRGQLDAFVGKFAATPWLSYIGGGGDDYGNAIAIRPSNGNIIIGGSTGSSAPSSVADFGTVPSTAGQFPLCPKTGAYFQGSPSTGAIFNGGSSDGFLYEFTSSGVFNWGTYRGGNNNDGVNGIAIGGIIFNSPYSATENILAVGETYSRDVSYYDPSTPAIPTGFNFAGTAPLNNGNSDGLFALCDNSDNLLYSDWCLGQYIYGSSSAPALDAGHINTSAGGIAVWTHHLFIAETTTNTHTLARTGDGDDGAGMIGVYQDAQKWDFNGGQLGYDPATVNSDAYFIRLSQKGMPMVMIGIPENEVQIPDFLVFPNPSRGLYNIKTDDMDVKGASIMVYDMLGRIVYLEVKTDLLSGHLKTIDISGADRGMYFIVVQTSTFKKTTRIIKQ